MSKTTHTTSNNQLSRNYLHILQLINNACKETNRSTHDVQLIAATKYVDMPIISQAIQLGITAFGENRVQDAARKWNSLPPNLSLHLIGPLQTNKVHAACNLFSYIHSLDRPKLALAIAKHAQQKGECPQLFVQVNCAEEPQKSGISPSQTDDFILYCRNTLDLTITGLMCIPPINHPPSLYFSMLHNIAQRNGLQHLSMGMSADFVAAIKCGATHVRIGSALLKSNTSPTNN